jgi:outer membrane protein
VLTARQLLVQAQTNYAQAKYGYLNNVVALRQAAGNLDRKTIDEINGWLALPAPPVAEPATPAVTTPAATATPPTPSAQN